MCKDCKQYKCVQCGERHTDYKMMADERICSQCEQQTREFQKVDLKRLLKTMNKDDVDEVLKDVDVTDEVSRSERFNLDCWREMIGEEISEWKNNKYESFNDLRDRIIKLIG